MGGEEEIRYNGGQPGGGGGYAGKVPLGPFCSSCFKVLFTKKKLNNNIVEIHQDPTS